MAEQILDSLRSHGVLSDSLQEKLAQIVPDDAKDKLSGFLQRYQELDDEGKEEVMNTVLGKLKEKFQGNLQSDSNFFTQLLFNNSYTVFFVALLLIVLVLVFFVYKLFKCLMERETKREEKKKSKQLKKKK
ncbi:uncharacterized protein LOC143374646 isoform X2 [Andrena cerasifolii]|uniref:uncharacterized protein LOC143374646 isoform X2 n=1 Tax=Andrena cerasifolii TaxID=2819439 RepID=UPI004037B654